MAVVATDSESRKKQASILALRILIPVSIAMASFLIDRNIAGDAVVGFLYLIAVLSCVWVPCPEAALYTAFALMVPMLLEHTAPPPGSSPWTGTTSRIVGVVVMWLIALIVWRNARLMRERERMLAELERLHDSSERAANIERIELSRWLHDGFAQQLVTLGWSVDRIGRGAIDERHLGAEARELRSVIDEALQTVHRKAVELRTWESQPHGLSALIDRYVAEFIARTGLAVELIGTAFLEDISGARKLVCLRVVQEGLTNVAKHASASRIVVKIWAEPPKILISITDDGRGIVIHAHRDSEQLGLRGLQERLSIIGGSLTVANAMPHGVRLEARIPLA